VNWLKIPASAAALSLRNRLMVLWSGRSLPVSQMASRLTLAASSSLRLEWVRLR
jgi:hypothetical protein|tara:strand:- start:406 stop:567 length:162 start_codon:yes stop_codon:yes gene_type:complete